MENTAEDETQVIMGETTERDGKTVTEWIFAIPDTTDVSQEGEWSLEAITLYGVYYNKLYYGEEGVTIDLSAEHIRTKVVNYVRVTLAGTSHADGNAFAGTFMTDHLVDDMTVTIEDYEHEPIQAEIGAVKVAYRLNSDKVSMDTYGYTASNLSTGVIVDAVGSSRQNDATVYDIGTLNFQQAGPYETCTVTFMLDGEPYAASTAQGAKASLQYKDGGRASELCPQFEVKWAAPDVKVILVKQPTGTDSSCNVKYTEYSGNSITDPYDVSVYWYQDTTEWFYPYVQVAISGVDPAYYGDAVIDVVMKAGARADPGTTYTKYFRFNSKGRSNSVSIGKIDGDAGDEADKGSRGAPQWREIENPLNTVTITSGSVSYSVGLEKSVKITVTTKS